MPLEGKDPGVQKALQEALGYLNFSSGQGDPRFLGNLNELFGRLNAAAILNQPVWKQFKKVLLDSLERFRGTSEAFREVGQAQQVIELVFEKMLPAYREFHRDLLFHQTDEALFGPFFVGRAFEAVLRQGAPWTESDRIVPNSIAQLNDFIGHRPVAVLHNEQRLQPYSHEWVRPVPLFIRDAGVAVSPYHDVVAAALEILNATDAHLLDRAGFHPEWLDELAFDPRAYDFDHPVNKRPNYHFGQWDPNCIDNSGRYRRFVVPQITVDSMLARLDQEKSIPREELLFEAAAVLAGTVLMGSGVSGYGPGAHDSTVTLATLLPQIATYRDEFYERLLKKMNGRHAKRLRSEASLRHQPFAGARQHLNQAMAKHRARQLQHSHVADLYAWMGYTEEALREAKSVSVASARLHCEIFCRLTLSHLSIDRGALAEAAAPLPEIEDLLQRAIQCGAFVDPWNILGFGGQFSLFPAAENAVHDHRVDDLIDLMSDIFELYTRLQKAAAAAGESELGERLSRGMVALAQWWDQFAVMAVSDLQGFSGQETWKSAVHVADVLREWHAAGTAAGDLTFWRSHVDRFQSAKAYALVVESLLEQHDQVAAMALLIQWLGQADEIALVEQDYSFHELILRWMDDLLRPDARPGMRPPQRDESEPVEPIRDPEVLRQRWTLARKLLDYVEANAEDYWRVPGLELEVGKTSEAKAPPPPQEEFHEGPEEPEVDPMAGLYAAAYEEMTFRDSADDGIEGEMIQSGIPISDFELAPEAMRLGDRLHFLNTLARLWRMTASALGGSAEGDPERSAVLAGWLDQASANQRSLSDLLDAVHAYPLPTPRGSHESMVEYDERRAVKEHLLEQIIATCVETADAARSIRAVVEPNSQAAAEQRAVVDPDPSLHLADWPVNGGGASARTAHWEDPALRVLRAVFRDDRKAARAALPKLLRALSREPLLYVSLARGGDPHQIVASRSIQRVLRRLLACLPRVGLLFETFQLMETIRQMERNHSVGPGAITEFDQLFEIGCRGIVRCLAASSKKWQLETRSSAHGGDRELIDHLEQIMEPLLHCWLSHSQRVRLSVMEAVADEPNWKTLRRFVEQFGADLFTQKFMSLGNLRAILHQGVDAFLHFLEEEEEPEFGMTLLDALGNSIARHEAVHWLEMILEAVVENYSEYIDYNSTTTQSDRGEMLYTLLDFLRLQASYNRVAWNLRPVVIAHEALVRSGRTEAAGFWRRIVSRRTHDIAEEHLRRFQHLARYYGMRLPSIAERLEEKFVRPLLIDRLRALLYPASEERRCGETTPSFELLRAEIDRLTAEPAGVGFEAPRWLEALEDEVEILRLGNTEEDEPLDPNLPIPEAQLSIQDVHRQISRMMEE